MNEMHIDTVVGTSEGLAPARQEKRFATCIPK